MYRSRGKFREAAVPPSPSSTQGPALWNPAAAVNWSLPLTPAFGAYLQMQNWKALGEPNRAASARRWFYTSLAMAALYLVLAFVIEDDKIDQYLRGLGFGFLIVWYVASGRSQIDYVKEKLGRDYERRPWGVALLCGMGGVILFYAVSIIIGLVIYVAGRT